MAKPDLKEKDLYSAICVNGHIQSSIIENIDNYTTKFCSECGSQVLTKCDCGEFIKGGEMYVMQDDAFRDMVAPDFRPIENAPNYCHSCGNSYPWVQKFLDEYKLILELQTEEINEEFQKKIYTATEEALKNKFKGNSMIILKLMFNKLNEASKTVMISTLTNVASTGVIKLLTGQ